jgi:hypothetical protein
MSGRRELERFIGRYSPGVARVARQALAKMRALVPGACELVYDNYNALAIAFGPTERASDAVASLALYPRWVSLFFARGAVLDDRDRILKGTGTTVRHIVLEDAATLDRADVRQLLGQAVRLSALPLPSGRGRTVIKSVSAKQRPRRPPALQPPSPPKRGARAPARARPPRGRRA